MVKKSVNSEVKNTPTKQQHNMSRESQTPDELMEKLKKYMERPIVGIAHNSNLVTGKQSRTKLVKYRKSLNRDDIQAIRSRSKNKNKILPGKSVFIGAASKKEESLLKTTDSKVLGLIFNPLDVETLERLEDCWIYDGEVQQSIAKYYGLILGNNFTPTISDKKQYQDDDVKNAAFEAIMAHEPYVIAKDKLTRILEKTDFKANYEVICTLASIYGRGAAEIIRDDETGDPVFINVLYSQLLGDPVIDKYHRFIGVEYQDLPDDDKFLELKGSINSDHKPAFKKDKIIYIANNDVPVTVGAKFYGIPTLEAIIDPSEAKRMILQKELKEWVAKSHSGNIILTTDEPIPQDDADELAQRLTDNQGNVTVLNYKMMAQSVAVTSHVDQLQTLIDTLNREMLRYIDMIGPLAGYENIQNYASIAKLIVVWMASTLNPQRLKHKKIIKQQFVDQIFQTCLLQQGEMILEDPYTYELKLYSVTYPETMTVRDAIITINKHLEDNPDFNLLEEFSFTEQSGVPACEITIEIDLPRFNDFVEISDKILSWVRERMMTKRKGLELADMEDQIDDIKKLDEEAELHREQMMKQGVLFDETGKPIPNFRNANTQDQITGADQAGNGKAGNGTVKAKVGEIDAKYKDPTKRTRAETESLNKKIAQKNKKDIRKLEVK